MLSIMKAPTMYRLTQTFSRPHEPDVRAATISSLEFLGLGETIQPGQKIGITVGSRGIQNLDSILATVIEYIRSCDASPFLLAAMGSHGGGSPEGQKEVLESLGINEESLHAPVITPAIARGFAGQEVD